jgi:hypothetical protein
MERSGPQRVVRAIDLAPPERRLMHKARHWLDYDSVAFAVLVVGMGAIELLALSI